MASNALMLNEAGVMLSKDARALLMACSAAVLHA